MTYDFGSLNNWGTLKKVALRTPAVAFHSDARIDSEWQKLNYHSRPDLDAAKQEFIAVEAILGKSGADVIRLPAGEGLTLDSLYTHDALVVTPRGLVRPRMGKPARRLEPRVNGAHLESLGIPVIGEIAAPGQLEGGEGVEDRGVRETETVLHASEVEVTPYGALPDDAPRGADQSIEPYFG